MFAPSGLGPEEPMPGERIALRPASAWSSPIASTRSSRRVIRDAVRCHFDEGQAPKVVRLHLVREELLAI